MYNIGDYFGKKLDIMLGIMYNMNILTVKTVNIKNPY